MASNEEALSEDRLRRRRERDRLRGEIEISGERDARPLNWAIGSIFMLKLCCIDWPDVENMTDIGMLL